MSKPIKPSEVAALKQMLYPDYVLDTFNELIAINFNGKKATIGQNKVIDLMLKKANNGLSEEHINYLTRADIFYRKYLDVETIYRSEGWSVCYDAPAYNESYEAIYTFSVQ